MIVVRALLSERQRRGAVFVPMHWTDQFTGNARVDTLVPGVTDPHSGQPALKHACVRIERFSAATYGFAVLKQKPRSLKADYWALARCEGGWRLELAFAKSGTDAGDLAASLFDAPVGAETLAYRDGATSRDRVACFDGDRLFGALFLAPEPVAVSRAWVFEQFQAKHDCRRARIAIIAGRPGAGDIDRGALVCSCLGIGVNEIAAAVAQGCRSVDAVGHTLGAGTNCGSCRGEIRQIIKQHRLNTETRHGEAAPVQAGERVLS